MNILMVRFYRIGLFIAGSTLVMGGYQNCSQMKNSKEFDTAMFSSIEKKRDGQPISPLPTLNQIGVALPQLSAKSVLAGQSLTYTNSFTGGPSKFPLKVFVHFLDANGNIAFEDNYYPMMSTVTWSTTFSDKRTITVPANISGTFKMVTGLFDETNGPREPLVYAAGILAIGENRYQISTLLVTQPVAIPPVASQPSQPSPGQAPAPAPAPVNYSGPFTITKGGTYSGNWESMDPNVAAVTVKTGEPVIIENCNIRSKGNLIFASWYGVNLTVQNCKALGLNPNVVDRNHGRFIAAEEFSSMIVRNNSIEKTAGIYLHADRRTATSKILVTQNYSKNIEGRRSNGAGGYTADFYRMQFLQLNAINNHPDLEISWNKIVNFARESWVEDVINLYNSGGTRDRPAKITSNLIDGAFGGDPAAAYSGGGIMLGDGNCEDGNVVVEGNTVLETSNYGIAVAGGNYQKILNNTVLGLGKLADGTFLDADSDAGIYLRDYCQSAKHDPSTVFAQGNTVGWGTPTPSNANGRWDVSTNPAVALMQNVSNSIIAAGPIDPVLLTNARNAWAVKSAVRQIGSK